MVVTAAVCILHYVIRLRFEALSSSRFQNISNGRCVVTACSAAARKSREGREQTFMPVYHYISYCMFPSYSTEVKIQTDFLRPPVVGQNLAWPVLSRKQRKALAVLTEWVGAYLKPVCCSVAPLSLPRYLEADSRRRRERLWKRPLHHLLGQEGHCYQSCS